MTLKLYYYRLLRNPGIILSKAYGVWSKEGFSGIKERILNTKYNEWIRLNDTLSDDDRSAIRGHISKMEYKPLISFVMPVYNTPERYLRLAIESVQKQLYNEWELCIADDASTLPHVRQVLEQYQKSDQRIKVMFREKNGHISAASNSALEMAGGEFIALMDHDDEIPEHALYMIAVELNANPETDLIYTDEDLMDANGQRYAPHFKSDWNQDLLESVNYVSHLGVYRTSIVRQIRGFREGFEGSQDYDLYLRVTEHTTGKRIRHIPYILYHWRSIKGSAAIDLNEKPYAEAATLKALKDHFAKIDTGIKVEKGMMPNTMKIVYPLPENPPLINLIITTIPNSARHDLLERCINSIRKKTAYKNYKIVVASNDGGDADNYSAIINSAVQQADSELIGLLHDDVEVINPEWLTEMISHAMRQEIGAVGAKLYYLDGKIQHACVVLSYNEIAENSHRHYPGKSDGYIGLLKLVQNCSAVSAACMVMRRSVYIEAGGMDEKELPVQFNDVDLCLRIRGKGYSIIWTPYAELYHKAFSSREIDDSKEKMKRSDSEVAYMRNRWGKVLGNDPFYNPNLSLCPADYSLSKIQRVTKPWKAWGLCNQ